MVTFHIGRLELAQQSVGNHACVKLQGASLSGEECPAISWDEFQVGKKTLKPFFASKQRKKKTKAKKLCLKHTLEKL